MMGRMHCVVPVGIAASLYGPDPGPIIVAGSAGVLPDIDEIKSHRGIGCGRCRYDGHVLSFGADMDPGGDERLDLPSCARCSIRWYTVMVAICLGSRIAVDARQLENVWIAGLHTHARWTGVIDCCICRSTVAACLDRSSERR